jgi:hypothetical protein
MKNQYPIFVMNPLVARTPGRFTHQKQKNNPSTTPNNVELAYQKFFFK